MLKYKDLSTLAKSQFHDEKPKPGELGSTLTALYQELKINHAVICNEEMSSSPNTMNDFLIEGLLHGGDEFMLFAKHFLELLYQRNSGLLDLIYRWIPFLLCRYIEGQTSKKEKIQTCVRVICEYESAAYKASKISTESSEKGKNLSSSLQQQSKAILFYLCYKHSEVLRQSSLEQYLRSILVYCGGKNETVRQIEDMDQVQKRNKFSVFLYQISEEEMQWMALTLYELAVQLRTQRYELLVALKLVHKKAVNEALFHTSEILQSALDLLEDEYRNIF